MAARYEIMVKDYFVFKKLNVALTGFPAKLSSVETVKPMFYYIDANGKIVVLDKAVKPQCLFNLYKTSRSFWLF